MLTHSLIEKARVYVSDRIRRTPVEESPVLSDRLGVPAWLKLESLQITGSFKVRGALFRLSRLSEEQRRAGVSTCSAGNHGKAVAYAARGLGLIPRIYVPRSVDKAKHREMVEMGAEVIVSEFEGYDDTEEWAMRQTKETGRVFVSAFDDEDVMAANGGTLALEVLDQVPQARSFVLPVGGGGLSGGFSFAALERVPQALIVGCQLEASPALRLSLDRGQAVTRLPAVATTAGGLEGGIGARPFEVLRSRIGRVALISEEEIFDAVRWMLAEHHYLVEPSAAVTVAACLTGKAGTFTSPAVVVLSGRNVALETVKKILG
ncbi:MAG TPA: pyridoxal-phosphate dependent enzyme [Thermoanaerobaculia bacterium]